MITSSDSQALQAARSRAATSVLYARQWATRQQDRRAFTEAVGLFLAHGQAQTLDGLADIERQADVISARVQTRLWQHERQRLRVLQLDSQRGLTAEE